MTRPRHPSARTVFTHPVHLIAFGLGAGLSPYAPGTIGTLAAVPLYLALAPLPLAGYAAATGVLLALGLWVCHRSSRLLGVHDHRGIVWDEVTGYLVTMLAAPPGWVWIAIGVVAFRVFDVAKPWPVRQVDRKLGGGLGIVLDDLVAGFYAFLVMQGLALLVGPLDSL